MENTNLELTTSHSGVIELANIYTNWLPKIIPHTNHHFTLKIPR